MPIEIPNLPPLYHEMDFDTFRVAPPITTANHMRLAVAAKETCIRYAENPYEKPFLIIWGGIGTGKTHLSLAIARNANLPNVKRASSTSLKWERNIDERNDRFDATYEELWQADLAIIDDCDFVTVYYEEGPDIQEASQWRYERIRSLIEYRQDRLMPTVLVYGDVVQNALIRDTGHEQVICLEGLPDQRIFRPNPLAPPVQV